nr:MFS transporter [Geodermatophilaceae bacterium]
MSGPGAERRRSADYAGRFEADGSAWSPWRVVVGFGAVSLAADMVYEGARAVYGPLLASLGATALIVGAVSGVGEAAALLLRLVFGPLADRTGRYWTITIVGYALTAICVPLLAITPFIGGAGLIVAAVLILSERIGKAIRSPAKSALLADAAGQVGMGRGLGVHKALDQIGAFAGPLLVAGMIGASAGIIWPGLAVLAIPGAVAMGLLVLTRRRMPDPDRLATAVGASPPAVGRTERAGASMAERVQRLWMGLPAPFLRLALGTSMCTAGLVTFGLIGFHLVQADLIATAGIPLLYAAAMGAGAIA